MITTTRSKVNIICRYLTGTVYSWCITGHWIIDTPISNPMSGYEEYRHSRTSWGIGVLGSLVVKITASDGSEGVATGFGGPPACWLIEQHYARFVVGQDPRNTQIMWDQMFRASMFYGRKGLPLAAISVVDLALWDLIGKSAHFAFAIFDIVSSPTHLQSDKNQCTHLLEVVQSLPCQPTASQEVSHSISPDPIHTSRKNLDSGAER